MSEEFVTANGNSPPMPSRINLRDYPEVLERLWHAILEVLGLPDEEVPKPE